LSGLGLSRKIEGAGDNPLTPAPVFSISGLSAGFTLPKTLLGQDRRFKQRPCQPIGELVSCEIRNLSQFVRHQAIAAAARHSILTTPLFVVTQPMLEHARHYESDKRGLQ
jgi:hypothetical protein